MFSGHSARGRQKEGERESEGAEKKHKNLLKTLNNIHAMNVLVTLSEYQAEGSEKKNRFFFTPFDFFKVVNFIHEPR